MYLAVVKEYDSSTPVCWCLKATIKSGWFWLLVRMHNSPMPCLFFSLVPSQALKFGSQGPIQCLTYGFCHHYPCSTIQLHHSGVWVQMSNMQFVSFSFTTDIGTKKTLQKKNFPFLACKVWSNLLNICWLVSKMHSMHSMHCIPAQIGTLVSDYFWWKPSQEVWHSSTWLQNIHIFSSLS